VLCFSGAARPVFDRPGCLPWAPSVSTLHAWGSCYHRQAAAAFAVTLFCLSFCCLPKADDRGAAVGWMNATAGSTEPGLQQICCRHFAQCMAVRRAQIEYGLHRRWRGKGGAAVGRRRAPCSELAHSVKDYRVVMLEEDLNALRAAVATLEHPGLAARLGEIAGKPIELLGRALPETASKAVAAATTKALNAALTVALRTMRNEPKAASSLLHKALAAASGAVGGSFGLAALPIELPISTIIMLRSIGDVARSEGEDLTNPETALSCLQVFALGGLKGQADAAESGYFAVRGLLAKSVAEAARFIVERGGVAEGAPVLVRLIAQIASRFGMVVTQKLAAQAVPVIGALGGAAVNYAFIDHFQDVARAHYVVRRLERRYGKDVVRTAYERLSGEAVAAA